MRSLLIWALLATTACSEQICHSVCDGDLSQKLEDPRKITSTPTHGRQVTLFVDSKKNAAFGRIEDGEPGDEVWIDRSWNGGGSWNEGSRIGLVSIPTDGNAVDTTVVNINGSKKQIGVVRTCGKAAAHKEIFCTYWQAQVICGKVCDGDASSQLTATRADSVKLLRREISLLVSKEDNAAFARISNGEKGDEVWLDRSWNNGKTWLEGTRMGLNLIPRGAQEVDTTVVNIDGNIDNNRYGSVRACGRVINRKKIVCTKWTQQETCGIVCDGEKSGKLSDPYKISSVNYVEGRELTLYVSDVDKATFGQISNGKAGDEVWLDRSWNEGKSWDGGSRLGLRTIPDGASDVNTTVVNEKRNKQVASIRACAKAAKKKKIVCTGWMTRQNCGDVCDGDPSQELDSARAVHSIHVNNREMAVFVSYSQKAAFGRISNAEPGDEIWLDRSWTGGQTWGEGSRLGINLVPKNVTQVDTTVMNINGNLEQGQKGVVRACGVAKGTIACTAWTASHTCNNLCDGDPPSDLSNVEKLSEVNYFGTRILVFFGSKLDTAHYGKLVGGEPGDEIWLDRSWNGGKSWEDGIRLGLSVIPKGESTVESTIVNYVGNSPLHNIGSIRACANAARQSHIVCTGWITRQNCGSVCDGDSSNNVPEATPLAHNNVDSRQVSIFVSKKDNAAFGRISNGKAGDEVWVDRSWDDGKSWDEGSRLGINVIPQGDTEVNTIIVNTNFNIVPQKTGVVRACGLAGGKLTCTSWTAGSKTTDNQVQPVVEAKAPPIFSTTIFGREVELYVFLKDNTAYGRIRNGNPGDEVWIDRSWDGGRTWNDGSRLGYATVSEKSREIATEVTQIDTANKIGVLRACGKAGDRVEIVCTSWSRGTIDGENPAKAAATALMMYYTSKGQWETTGWWNAANCLTAIIDYIKVTGDTTFKYAINRTYELNKNEFEGNFRNDFIDDSGWWGLAWVGAYDLTGEEKYLETAKIIADYMYSFKDDDCGGGIWWSTARTYKNAITNELFIKLAASVHNRAPKDSKYMEKAQEIYQWFLKSGMINKEYLINDGLNEKCENNNGITWTYNQGVLLGGLVAMYNGTSDKSYLDEAKKIADSATSSSYLSPNGILHEPCDHDRIDCGADGQSFKGVFARNLRELNSILGDKRYSSYIQQNADMIYKNRNSIDQYGLHYEGPFEFHSAGTQHSALEMLTAVL